jgi:hypothetical protein
MQVSSLKEAKRCIPLHTYRENSLLKRRQLKGRLLLGPGKRCRTPILP